MILKEETLILNFVYKTGTIEKEVEREKLENCLSNGEKKALYILNILYELKARELEGKRLKEDILRRASILSSDVEIVSGRSSSLLDEYKKKLENRVKELNASEIVDENRLGIEIVMFADKSSICEEVTRLKSHLNSLSEMLESDGPVGKKMDFLVQEMNREVNTIGSKANCLDITNTVIEMKNEIENIREQIQNIE